MRHLSAQVQALQKAMPVVALVAVPEAARALGVSGITIRRMIRSGKLPSVRVGRSVRVDLAGVRPPSEAEVEPLADEATRRI